VGPAAKPQRKGRDQGKKQKRSEKISDHVGKPPSARLSWTGAAAISQTKIMRGGSQCEAIGVSSFALRDQPIDSQTNSESQLRCV
jgi:hypothetical protein